MIETIIIVSHLAYSELPKWRNVNASTIRDCWQYDSRASRYGIRRTLMFMSAGHCLFWTHLQRTCFEDSELEALLAEDSCQTQEKLAESLRVTQLAISKRLQWMRMIQKQENCVPYELKPRYVEWRFFPSEKLLQRQSWKEFMENARTCIHVDGQTVYSRCQGYKLCIWWDQFDVVYYELLKPSETITGNRYRTQLMRFSRALKEKRP